MDEQILSEVVALPVGVWYNLSRRIAHPFGLDRDGQGAQRDFRLIWQWAVVDYGIRITF
jgi:hypothetical protein